LCIACPVTTTARPYPFHVPIPEGVAISGVVMVDQVMSIDFRARDVKRVGPAPADVLERVLAILDACIFQHQAGQVCPAQAAPSAV